MPHYIAFLRGINVGGHRVAMARLREIFEELGLRDVSTFIASGNVVFGSDAEDPETLRLEIEAHLADRLGYAVPTFIRTRAELEAVVAHAGPPPAQDAGEGASLYVIFLHEAASDELRGRLLALRSEMDDFEVAGREVFWRIQCKLSDSPLFGGGIEKATAGWETTMRNVTTLRRLAAKLA